MEHVDQIAIIIGYTVILILTLFCITILVNFLLGNKIINSTSQSIINNKIYYNGKHVYTIKEQYNTIYQKNGKVYIDGKLVWKPGDEKNV